MRQRIQTAKKGVVQRQLSRIGSALIVLMMAGCVDTGLDEEAASFRQIKVGMTEAYVRETLGDPLFTYEKETAPEDYYVKGYSFKKRDITHRVLIYKKAEPICYVYIDTTGVVEDVFVGGS
jgi:outer membrane protein assembly factor BamE (lipoprotein component of BamABCDE complex)